MLKRFLRYIDLRGQEEKFDEIDEYIRQGVSFRGTNIWILACAIVIASIGLNTNSTAVIIGAMLISPLMGPIIGMGYGVATYDFKLLKSSVANFTLAVAASLVVSTAYFLISPVNAANSELLARTSPTIFDVLIALFGGFAGIIAVSSTQKGNVIPGVAIATALMPPLCTVGYGLATWQSALFGGALYLFTINTVCIGFAAAAVSRFLKFPIRRKDLCEERKVKINRITSIVIIVTILPSIYLGYLLVREERFRSNAKAYIEDVGLFRERHLLKSNVNVQRREILLIYGGSLTEVEEAEIRGHAKNHRLDEAIIRIDQTSDAM